MRGFISTYLYQKRSFNRASCETKSLGEINIRRKARERRTLASFARGARGRRLWTNYSRSVIGEESLAEANMPRARMPAQ
jgi:hypothetical protein